MTTGRTIENQQLRFGTSPQGNYTDPDQPPSQLSDMQKMHWAFMTPGQRKKAERDARRTKVTYDLPDELIAQIAAIVNEHKIPASQLATLLMQWGLKAMSDGQFNINTYKVRSTSPRYEWVLNLDSGSIPHK